MSRDKLAALDLTPRELQDVSQSRLERKLLRSSRHVIDKPTFLGIYTKWMTLQIPRLGYHSALDSTVVYREGCDFLAHEGYDKGPVLASFSNHQDEYLKCFPNGKREFNYARRDIEIHFKKLVDQPRRASVHSATATSSTFNEHLLQTRAPLSSSASQQSDLQSRRSSFDKSKYNGVSSERLEWLSAQNEEETIFAMPPPAAAPAVPTGDYLCKRCERPGLPWDDAESLFEQPNVGQFNQPTSTTSFSSDQQHATQFQPVNRDAMEEDFIPLTSEEEWEQAGIEADAFLESFGMELASYGYVQPSSTPSNRPMPFTSPGSNIAGHNSANEFGPDISQNAAFAETEAVITEESKGNDDDDSACSLMSSPVPRGAISPDIDGDVCMTNAAEGSVETPTDGQAIVPYQTVKPLQGDPPYDPRVKTLFQGREHENVYVNVVGRNTAMDMYEDEETRAAKRMSRLTVKDSASSKSED
ncbi:hypothetical protein K4K59_011441 [Colletotrichum sp. SAR11_240]|nr:hypothetical protein K4K59_011441 [Colletotrichum sp. SAR11_240]